MSTARMRVVVPLVAAASVLLGACEYEGAASLPLPGAAGGGGYEISMVFDDVTNLVTRETCRANDVVVGSVDSITLQDDLTARVVCRIDPDVELAGNARATLRETSLLGERYVALDPPAGEQAVGTLAPGAEIDQADTHVVPDVEVVFGALSQVLNGGGLANIDTITRELSTAFGEADVKGTTRDLAQVVGVLDDHRDEITDSLEAVGRLADQLARQRDVIGSALEAVPAGLAVLERQRPRLVQTLTRLSDLSEVAVPLIESTRADTVANLRHLAPILEQLHRARRNLPRAIEAITSFPFPSYTPYVTKGDYAGMFATISFDIDSLNTLLAEKAAGGLPLPAAASSPEPTIPEVPELLPEIVQDLLDDLVPGLPGGLGGLGGLGSLGGLRDGAVTGRTSVTAPRDLAELLTGGGR